MFSVSVIQYYDMAIEIRNKPPCTHPRTNKPRVTIYILPVQWCFDFFKVNSPVLPSGKVSFTPINFFQENLPVGPLEKKNIANK